MNILFDPGKQLIFHHIYSARHIPKTYPEECNSSPALRPETLWVQGLEKDSKKSTNPDPTWHGIVVELSVFHINL